MRKKLLAIIATIAMVVAMTPSMVFGDAATEWTSTTSLPTNSGSYKLTDDVTVNSLTTIAAGKTVTLDLNGYTVTFSGSAYYQVNGKLIVEDSSVEKSGTIANDAATSANCVIKVNGGECTMNGGKILHSRSNSGNAVYVAKAGAIFTMNDGVVESKTGNYQGERGAISAQSGSTVVINGGEIIANTMAETSNGVLMGAAIECYGTVIITGGTINASGIAFSYVKDGLTIDPAEGKEVNVTAGKRIVDLQPAQTDTVKISGGVFDAPDFIDDDYGEDDAVAVSGGEFKNGNASLNIEDFLAEGVKQDDNGNVVCAHKETKVVDAKDATCTEDGYTGDKVCKDCETVIENGEAVEATGHTFEDGVCACGEKAPATNDGAEGESAVEPTEEAEDAVDTGDNMNMVIPFVIAGLALAAMAVVVATRRRAN